jgi:hypothetical protein
MGKMKIAFMAVVIVLLMFILILAPGCIKQKSYDIKVYTIDWKMVNLLESKEGPVRDIFIKQYTSVRTYKAKEVISFDETSVRFIDEAGKEQFFSADKIEVNPQ